jgi:hypothetical protein
VADPQPRRSRARDRQWVKRKVSQSLRQAVLAVRPEADVRQLIRRDPRIEGEFEAHQFDYGLSNGELRRLVHTLSAEGSNRVAVKTEIDAVAWAIDDVRKARTALLIDVVAIGEGKILDSAQKVYEGLEANLVREEQVEHWSEAVALGLVTALH